MEKSNGTMLDYALIAKAAKRNEMPARDSNGDDLFVVRAGKVAVCRSSNSCGMPAITVIFSSQTQRIL
jgi:hypothetical protein